MRAVMIASIVIAASIGVPAQTKSEQQRPKSRMVTVNHGDYACRDDSAP